MLSFLSGRHTRLILEEHSLKARSLHPLASQVLITSSLLTLHPVHWCSYKCLAQARAVGEILDWYGSSSACTPPQMFTTDAHHRWLQTVMCCEFDIDASIILVACYSHNTMWMISARDKAWECSLLSAPHDVIPGISHRGIVRDPIQHTATRYQV